MTDKFAYSDRPAYSEVSTVLQSNCVYLAYLLWKVNLTTNYVPYLRWNYYIYQAFHLLNYNKYQYYHSYFQTIYK